MFEKADLSHTGRLGLKELTQATNSQHRFSAFTAHWNALFFAFNEQKKIFVTRPPLSQPQNPVPISDRLRGESVTIPVDSTVHGEQGEKKDKKSRDFFLYEKLRKEFPPSEKKESKIPLANSLKIVQMDKKPSRHPVGRGIPTSATAALCDEINAVTQRNSSTAITGGSDSNLEENDNDETKTDKDSSHRSTKGWIRPMSAASGRQSIATANSATSKSSCFSFEARKKFENHLNAVQVLSDQRQNLAASPPAKMPVPKISLARSHSSSSLPSHLQHEHAQTERYSSTSTRLKGRLNNPFLGSLHCPGNVTARSSTGSGSSTAVTAAPPMQTIRQRIPKSVQQEHVVDKMFVGSGTEKSSQFQTFFHLDDICAQKVQTARQQATGEKWKDPSTFAFRQSKLPQGQPDFVTHVSQAEIALKRAEPLDPTPREVLLAREKAIEHQQLAACPSFRTAFHLPDREHAIGTGARIKNLPLDPVIESGGADARLDRLAKQVLGESAAVDKAVEFKKYFRTKTPRDRENLDGSLVCTHKD